MSTAIFRTFTSEGFVIAADGRRRKGTDGPIVSDTVRKIFSIEDDNRSLAYAMTGGVYIQASKGGEFDFSIEASKAAALLRSRKPADLTRYAELFSEIVNDSLLAAVSSGQLLGYPTLPKKAHHREIGETIVNLFFIGYFEGRPSWTDVRFWHQHQNLKKPEIFSERIRTQQMKISGSEVVADLLFQTTDPRFSVYRVNAPTYTLAKATDIARNYILACCDPVALQIDPNCADIGGHIHMAIITPAEGFRWIAGFEPAPLFMLSAT